MRREGAVYTGSATPPQTFLPHPGLKGIPKCKATQGFCVSPQSKPPPSLCTRASPHPCSGPGSSCGDLTQPCPGPGSGEGLAAVPQPCRLAPGGKRRRVGMVPREPSALSGVWPPSQILASPPEAALGPLRPCQGAPGAQGSPPRQGTSLQLPSVFWILRGPYRTCWSMNVC